ncbi:MAG: aldehyde ferredoxin oxidoreductase, partial [Actinobacteria bacterium]|nr:aldehyde ferredoxin oxidoreductase [Actinomycetota bacterium]
MPTYGGWTGKTLRVDLTTRTSTVESTLDKYKDFWGGTGMGYKVLWDEVPADTDPYDPKNRLIFGWGPLTGTGAPCGGRTCITSISPQHPKHAVATGHMGGHFSAEAKYAGWDGIIVQGKASAPVYIAITDDKVEIVECGEASSPGGKLWGTGIYNATDAIVKQMGGSCQVAAIGQAGENLVAQSVIMTGYSHSAGGQGSIMGAKNLKAIGIVGTGTVQIAAEKKAWRSLIDNAMALIGSNNQAVVPNSPQPWSEYVSSARWYGSKGKYWGAANPPVDTGTCQPHDR